MSARAQPQLEIAPLLALSPDGLGCLAARIGVSVRTVNRCKATGHMPLFSADAAAVALGRHPFNVWGNDWFTAVPA